MGYGLNQMINTVFEEGDTSQMEMRREAPGSIHIQEVVKNEDCSIQFFPAYTAHYGPHHLG